MFENGLPCNETSADVVVCKVCGRVISDKDLSLLLSTRQGSLEPCTPLEDKSIVVASSVTCLVLANVT